MGLAIATCVPFFMWPGGGMGFAGVQLVFHRGTAWVLQGCNKCATGYPGFVARVLQRARAFLLFYVRSFVCVSFYLFFLVGYLH